jgi:hypothetical protein
MKRWVSPLLLLLLLSGLMVLRTGDFGVRLAMNDDIVPVSYAYYWEQPARFSRDILSTYARDYTLSSLSNWLPALLLRAIDLPPETSAWALLYLQNVLLGLAIWRYTRLVTRQAGLAWLAVLFAYAAQPWCWNLANYASKLFAPYPGQLALPILLFAACAVWEGRRGWAVGWLALGGLIHPSLTLYMLAIVGLYWLWPGRRDLRPLDWLIALAGVAAVCVAPAFYLRLTGGEAVSRAELMRVLLDNLHATPWRHGATFAASALSFAGGVVLGLAGLRSSNEGRLSIWLAATGVACVLFALVQAAGLLLASPLLLQLIPLRATLFLPVLALPFIVRYLAARATGRSFVARWAAVALLLLAAAFVYGLAWGPLAALILGEVAESRGASARPAWSRRLHLAGAAVMALWLVAGLLDSVWLGWPLPAVIGMLPTVAASTIEAPGVRLDSMALVVVIVAVMAAGVAWLVGQLAAVARSETGHSKEVVARSETGHSKEVVARSETGHSKEVVARSEAGRGEKGDNGPRMNADERGKGRKSARPRVYPRLIANAGLAVLVAVLFSVAVFKAWRMGAETRQPMAVALYQAQRWAREQTPETAGFIAFGLGTAWRPVSLRWTIDPQPVGWYLYAGGQATKAFDDAYLDFYGVGPDGDIAAAYRSLDEAGILRLAQRFGGDYIVRPVSEPLKFPEVYRNAGYVIYQLNR